MGMKWLGLAALLGAAPVAAQIYGQSASTPTTQSQLPAVPAPSQGAPFPPPASPPQSASPAQPLQGSAVAPAAPPPSSAQPTPTAPPSFPPPQQTVPPDAPGAGLTPSPQPGSALYQDPSRRPEVHIIPKPRLTLTLGRVKDAESALKKARLKKAVSKTRARKIAKKLDSIKRKAESSTQDGGDLGDDAYRGMDSELDALERELVPKR